MIAPDVKLLQPLENDNARRVQVTNEEKQKEAAAAAAATAASPGAPPVAMPAVTEPESRMTLTKVVYRLKKWKHLLGCRVFRAPSEVPLQRCSPYLAQVHCELETWHSSSQARIEIPGQYASCDGEPRPDLHAKLLRFHSTVSVLHRHGFSQRRLSMLGSDGRRYFFLVQFAIPHVTRTDERVMQVHSMLRKFLERDPQTRGRDLAVQVPVVVPITPRMRLMEDHEAFVSLGEIYEADRHRQGLDPDAPIMLCRERVSAAVAAAADKEAGKKAESEERLKVFNEICSKDVTADILTRYVHGVVKDAEAVWAFRRHFAAQAGISSLLCHIFTCGERFPHRIIFDKRTARVVSWEFRPGYTHAGLLEQAEDVPFRLTRNMSTLMSPMLVEGVLALTMVSMSGALMAKKEVLEPFLALILRDDLLSWHVSKAPVNRTEEQQKAVDVQLKERIGMNVTKVMSRLDKLKPRVRNNAHGQPMPVDRAVHDLIAAAQSESNLAKMSPTFLSFV
ncbi:unnamed protein product [Ectocarpus sp. CCAP 1310/34]|nr:unnamed protein product [Ectocarpus sp. CCAP 1310/34]